MDAPKKYRKYVDLDKIERKFVNKHSDYWAAMRTNMNLMHRSEHVADRDWETVIISFYISD